MVMPLAGFVAALFLFYTLVPIMLKVYYFINFGMFERCFKCLNTIWNV